MILIGIDPAFRKDGFAIAIIESKTVRFKMFSSFLDFVRWAMDDEERPQGKIVVGVENSNLVKATFKKNASGKHSRNVGANQAASQYTVDFCRWCYGESNVVEMTPKQKGAKWKPSIFRSIVKQNGHTLYGYKGNVTEQDKRDAYQIALVARKMYSFRQAKIKKA